MFSDFRSSRRSVLCPILGIFAVIASLFAAGCTSSKSATPVPVLSIASTHTGGFSQGQQAATYLVTVSNSSAAGTAATNGTTVTVTDTVPSGLTLVSMAGTGWTCVNPSCTRTDALAAATSYPAITVTVNVAAGADSPQVNSVGVTGGGSVAANGTDSTIILVPVLGITKSHTGNFAPGQQGATYTVTVGNTGTAATNGTTVTVTDTVPTGLTLVSMAGTGWTCVNPSCSRTDALATAASYPAITVTVNVAANASTPQVNAASVTGGGSANAQTTDSTKITVPVLHITKTHTGNFTQGQTNAPYSVTVDNNNGLAATSGMVTVTETVPSGLTLVSMAGTNWTCPGASANTCNRSDALAAGSSYEPITVTVNVGEVAASPQVNAVAVSGGGSSSANATDSTTIASSCPMGGNLSVLNGQYTFLMSGFNASGPLTEAVAFDADGQGHIGKLVGVADINSASGAPLTNTPIIAASSSYTLGTDNRGCLVITTSAGTSTFRISLGTLVSSVATKGRFVEFDSSGATGSGVLLKQTPSGFASVGGNYAFGASASVANSTRFGIAGVFTLSSGTVAGSYDINNSSLVSNTLQANVDNAGSTYPASPLTLPAGSTYTMSTTTGRGTLTLGVGGGTVVHASLYAVSSSEILFMCTDAQNVGGQNGSPAFTGTMLLQSGTLALNGTGVLQLTGADSDGTNPLPNVQVGVFSVTSPGNFSLSSDQNQAGTTTSQGGSGTFTVNSSTGRTTLALGGGAPPLFYLVTANKGFVLGTDRDVTTGFFEPQTAVAITPPTTFSFGSVAPASPSVADTSGVVTLAAAGVESGTVDLNAGNAFDGGQAFTGTYSSFDSNGRGTITGANGTAILYLISATKGVLMPDVPIPANTNPSIQVAEQ
jgi:uncharacterized repeat protein (TIGR01451 family)